MTDRPIAFHDLATLSAEARSGLMQRAEADLGPFLDRVRPIVEAVRDEGDAALARFAREFRPEVPWTRTRSPPPRPISTRPLRRWSPRWWRC